jgi:hypothetical protein
MLKKDILSMSGMGLAERRAIMPYCGTDMTVCMRLYFFYLEIQMLQTAPAWLPFIMLRIAVQSSAWACCSRREFTLIAQMCTLGHPS